MGSTSNIVSESDCEMPGMLNKIANAISNLDIKKVPPPVVFSVDIYGTIENFVSIFEGYCLSVYGNNQLSWLQVLPSFLNGEPKQIVLAFGLDANISYRMVIDRLVWELTPTGLQDQFYQSFCDTTKSSSETFSCYAI